jgi:uncharacterized RDD family membrane protein YckC
MTTIQKYDTFGKRFLAGIVDTAVFVPFILLQNYFEDRNHSNGFIIATIAFNICWMIYVVIGHGKYGQTVGKRVMGLKVFALNEKDVIGFKRAFYREAIWFFATIIAIVYFINSGESVSTQTRNVEAEFYGGYLDLFSGIWFIMELITISFNAKRRALHDLIAGSVVIDLNDLKREELQNRHRDVLESN